MRRRRRFICDQKHSRKRRRRRRSNTRQGARLYQATALWRRKTWRRVTPRQKQRCVAVSPFFVVAKSTVHPRPQSPPPRPPSAPKRRRRRLGRMPINNISRLYQAHVGSMRLQVAFERPTILWLHHHVPVVVCDGGRGDLARTVANPAIDNCVAHVHPLAPVRAEADGRLRHRAQPQLARDACGIRRSCPLNTWCIFRGGSAQSVSFLFRIQGVRLARTFPCNNEIHQRLSC